MTKNHLDALENLLTIQLKRLSVTRSLRSREVLHRKILSIRMQIATLKSQSVPSSPPQ